MPKVPKTIRWVGNILLGGALTVGVIGGGVRLNDFNAEGTPSTTVYVANEHINVQCTNTGGKVTDTIRYDTCYVENPLASIGAGTGYVKNISLQVSNNGLNRKFTCGFVKARKVGSGTTIPNLTTKTLTGGNIAIYSTGSLRWNSADAIACKTDAALGAGFAGRLRIEYADDFSE